MLKLNNIQINWKIFVYVILIAFFVFALYIYLDGSVVVTFNILEDYSSKSTATPIEELTQPFKKSIKSITGQEVHFEGLVYIPEMEPADPALAQASLVAKNLSTAKIYKQNIEQQTKTYGRLEIVIGSPFVYYYNQVKYWLEYGEWK